MKHLLFTLLIVVPLSVMGDENLCTSCAAPTGDAAFDRLNEMISEIEPKTDEEVYEELREERIEDCVGDDPRRRRRCELRYRED